MSDHYARPTTPSPIPITSSPRRRTLQSTEDDLVGLLSSTSLLGSPPSARSPVSFVPQHSRRLSIGRSGELMDLGYGDELTGSPSQSLYPSSPLRPSSLAASGSPSSARLAPGLGLGPPSTSPVTPQGSFARKTSRRLSSSSMLGPGAGFAGSYEASLLSFRFSTTPSPPLPFRLSIGVLGLGPSTPPSLKCPAHISVPLSAHFFPLTPPAPTSSTSSPTSSPSPSSPNLSAPSSSSVTPQQTPYLSCFDLSDHHLSSPPAFPSLLGPFPGYQVPPKGQLQLVISNPTGTGVKVFLVAYDCEGMKEGERMVVRLKEYETEPAGKETLRGSAVVHICSPPPTGAKTGDAASPPDRNEETSHPTPPPSQKYYLHSTLRLVFSPLSPSKPNASKAAPQPSTRSIIDLGALSLGPARFMPFDPSSDPDYLAYIALRKARRKEVKGTQSAAESEERGRRGSVGSGRERGEGGEEGVVLSFGKRREVVGRRKGEEKGGKRREEVESELSRRLRGMGMVGR